MSKMEAITTSKLKANHSESLPSLEENLAALCLNEDYTTSGSKIQEIRNWIESEDKLYAHTDDFTILRFLRYCKFNIEKTKKRLYNYYEQRTQSPDWFSDRNPYKPELQKMFDLGFLLPVKDLNADGKMIIILRPTLHNPRQHKLAHVIKAGKMILDIATRSNISVSWHGVIVIMDMTGVTLGHAIQLTPNIIRRLVHSWQDCYPLRIQSLNIVNAPTHIHVVLNIFKRFMNHKLRSKITIYPGAIKDFFVTHYPMSCHLLPTEFGGTTGTLQNLIEYWKTEAQNNSTWYMEDEKYRIIS